MSSFNFFDYDGALIRHMYASDCLPDEVARTDIYGPYDSTKSSYKLLTSMLKNSTRTLESINIFWLSAESPEFLAFLVLICNKAYRLSFRECRLATNAMSCLMAALLAHDGIGELKLQQASMPTNQAKILLEGVASSPCLKFFEFNVREFTNSQEVGRYFINALRRNQSLEGVDLKTYGISRHDPTFLPDIVKASILCPNMYDVSIRDSGPLPLDVLEGVLCRKDCTVRGLHLFGVEISTGDRWGSVIQNSSVTHLAICDTPCDWDKFGLIISLFKSLEQLELPGNFITRLSFLDPLLFGECSKLRSLDVSENLIGGEEMGRFIEKLRTIRGLKHLAIENDDNHWEQSDPIHNALIDALRHNTDLEHVDFDSKDLPLDLNRGGRRIFESSEPFPMNLLPQVFERASNISYYERGNQWGYPSNTKARADVVFWMIKRIAPQL